MNQERIAVLEAQAKFIKSGLQYADHGAYGQDMNKLEAIGQEINSLKPRPVYTMIPDLGQFAPGKCYNMHIAFSFNDYHAVLVTILETKAGGKLVCRVRSHFGNRVDEIQEIDQAFLEKYARLAN